LLVVLPEPAGLLLLLVIQVMLAAAKMLGAVVAEVVQVQPRTRQEETVGTVVHQEAEVEAGAQEHLPVAEEQEGLVVTVRFG